MTLSTNRNIKESIPNSQAIYLAKTSREKLASLPKDHSSYTFKFILNGNQEESVTIPAVALEFLVDILQIVSQGNTLTITPVTKDIQIYQAADILGVSQDYVCKLLDENKIPYKRENNVRIIHYEDVIEYRNQNEEERRKILDELVADAQELDMGY